MTYRRRLREAMTADELAQVYAETFDAGDHVGHRLRREITGSLTRSAITKAGSHVVAVDLAAGRHPIAFTTSMTYVGWQWVLGDIALGHELHGPIEEMITLVDGDIIVMAEIIEHVDDPDALLRNARRRFKSLVLTTPIAEGVDDHPLNPEHYWGWDHDAVQMMLFTAGWKDIIAQVDLNIRDERIAPTQMWSVR